MKKLFSCKLLSVLLALTLLFASAVSLKPTQKANADNVYWAGYWQSVLDRFDFSTDGEGSHFCYIINIDLLQQDTTYSTGEIPINGNTDIEDLNDIEFFQEMAKALSDKVGIPYDAYMDENGIIDTSEIFSQIDMDILVRNSSNNHTTVNILTGQYGTVFDPTTLENKSSTTEDSYIVGMAYVIEQNNFFVLLRNLYVSRKYSWYSYHASYIGPTLYSIPISIEPIPVYPPIN